MSLARFPEIIDSQIPALVRAYLAADAVLPLWLTIADHDYEELAGPIRAPYLAVVPAEVKDREAPSGVANAEYPVDLVFFLPRQTPAVAALTTPSAPTTVGGAAGAVTGTFRHSVTYYTATGESYASDLSDAVTVAGQRITVTIPTGPAGTVGRRVWRTQDGRLCDRFLDVVADNTTTVYSDNYLDAALGGEIAPFRYLGRRLAAAAKVVVSVNRTLKNLLPGGGGRQMTDATMTLIDKLDHIDASRNQRVKVIRCLFSIHYAMATRLSVIEP